ncbi:MAG: DeoR/GlpR transcriptional regulator [Chloroflexi bacterium]|nr:DeoR/GlpR transcriptional regulator [Chloroflexota bacterium]
MLAEERRLRIVELINQRRTGVVSVAELSDTFGVSSMTIRRDLDNLEEMALLRRVHGGAAASHAIATEKPYQERSEESSQEKQSIGWAAAQLIGENDRVLLDAGTTTLQIARNLEGKSGITAVTNALPVASELAHYRQFSTIVLGGMLKDRELCTVGPSVTEQLARLSVDKLFLSAAGFSLARGITDSDLMEVAVKQAMLKAAREVILVVDSSKWNVVNLVQICTLDAVHAVVTDDRIFPEAIEGIEAEGVRVITADRLSGNSVVVA